MRSNSAPTLVHVARLAGVGVGTASRALSGEGYVAKDTRTRIHEAAERLGYHRNELARSLRVNRSWVVGIVVPDIGGQFMIECVRSAQNVLRRNKYMSVLAFTDLNAAAEKEEIEYLMRRQIDGFLVVPADDVAPYLASPQHTKTPFVFFDRPISNRDYDAILVKNRQGARNAVQHLIGHGHKRIACVEVYGHHVYTVRERLKGYREAIQGAGLNEYLALIDPPAIVGQFEEWLAMKLPPTAVFSLTEMSTIKVIEALSALRVRIPDQMAFVGFDETQVSAFLDPPVTTVAQPATMIGENAAMRLIERLNAKEPMMAKRIMLDTMLVLRRSCGCHPNP